MMVCSSGQYLLIKIEQRIALCMPCSPQCETCTSERPDRCTKCKKEYLEFLSDDIQCKSCNDFVGLKKGSGYACDGKILIETLIEICGDGRHMGISECDDGNLLDGDGCSSSCVVESNHFCYGGNAFVPDICNSTLPLQFKKTIYYGNKTISITFNKPAYFLSK